MYIVKQISLTQFPELLRLNRSEMDHGCLSSHPIKFQVDRDSHLYWWRQKEYPEKNNRPSLSQQQICTTQPRHRQGSRL